MKKKLKITYNAPVILTFVFLCFTATLLGLITDQRSTRVLFSVFRGSLASPMTYIRMLTHSIGHVDWEHVVGNAMYLLLIGPMLEEKYGSNTMLKVILATALTTGIIHCVLFETSSLCGASGIVFACIVLASFAPFREGELPLSFVAVSILFIGKEIYSVVAVADNISNLTHIVGGMVGGVFGYCLNKTPCLEQTK